MGTDGNGARAKKGLKAAGDLPCAAPWGLEGARRYGWVGSGEATPHPFQMSGERRNGMKDAGSAWRGHCADRARGSA